MKKLIVLLIFVASNAFAAFESTSDYNTINFAYTATTVQQRINFNSAMQSGGTFTFEVQARNGGGRNYSTYPTQDDTGNVKIVFYNSSNAVVGTAQTNYTKNLQGPTQWSTAPGDTDKTFQTLSISSSNCQGSCANVAYAVVQMVGTDGAFWAGNYGPQWKVPTFTFNGGANMLYNPEFGNYNSTIAQGWTPSGSSFASNCGTTSGSSICVTANTAVTVNKSGGGYSSVANTASAPAGGYTSTLSVSNQTPSAGPPAQTTTQTNFLTFQTWDVEHYNANGWAGTIGGSITTGWTWSCTNCGTTTSGTVDRVNLSSDGTVIFVYILDSNGNMVISEPGGVYTYSGVPAGPTVTGTNTSYTYRTVVSGNVSKVYRTPVTTTTYSDNTTTSTNGNEELYSTATSTVTEVSSSNTQSGVVTTTTTRTDTVMGDGSQTTSYSSSSVTTPWPSYVTIGSGSVSNDIVITPTSNITIPQQTKIDLWTNKTIADGNKIYIDQISGSGNTVTMDQDGNKNLINTTINGNSNNITARQGVPGIGQNEIKINTVGDSNTLSINQARTTQGSAIGTNGHYKAVDINGSNNTLTTQQSNGGGVGGQYMETTINGNQNNVTAKQTDNGNKIMFNTIAGNNNTIDAVQKGTGQHYLENKLTGNNNSISAVQEGSIGNRATLDLTNAGGPASVILQQNGGMNVTVTTSCATAGGCAPITVRQGY
jgi:hypothetical protein